MNLFHLLETHFNAGKSLLINWYYDPDDEASLEEGQDSEVGLEVHLFRLFFKAKGNWVADRMLYNSPKKSEKLTDLNQPLTRNP